MCHCEGALAPEAISEIATLALRLARNDFSDLSLRGLRAEGEAGRSNLSEPFGNLKVPTALKRFCRMLFFDGFRYLNRLFK